MNYFSSYLIRFFFAFALVFATVRASSAYSLHMSYLVLAANNLFHEDGKKETCSLLHTHEDYHSTYINDLLFLERVDVCVESPHKKVI